MRSPCRLHYVRLGVCFPSLAYRFANAEPRANESMTYVHFLRCEMGPPNLEIWKLILIKLTETFITSTRCRRCGLGFMWVMNEGRIFGPRRDEVTGDWRRLHNEELNDLYSSPNTVLVIKSRRMRWAGHVARMGEERGVYRVLVGKPEGKNHWGDLGVDGWIILRWISRRWDVGMWTGPG